MRRGDDCSEMPGQDSFLDIVANIVGILILLVMVVGVRASYQPSSSTPVEAKSKAVAEREVKQVFDEVATKRHEVAELVQKAVLMRSEALMRDQERTLLSTHIAAIKSELAERQGALDDQARRDFELRRELAEVQLRLDELAREQIAAMDFKPQIEQVESLPTPLAKTVKGDEVHLRLSNGHVSYIPLEPLLEAFQSDAKLNVWRLENRSSASSVVGPIGGFRLRYYLQKVDVTVPGRGSGTLVQVSRWQLLPARPVMGEPVSQAVQENSELLRRLGKHSPHNTTVTVWLYSDSFNEFRELKQALFDKGFATAARPLPDGLLIGGSPSGSKSAAQ